MKKIKYLELSGTVTPENTELWNNLGRITKTVNELVDAVNANLKGEKKSYCHGYNECSKPSEHLVSDKCHCASVPAIKN